MCCFACVVRTPYCCARRIGATRCFTWKSHSSGISEHVVCEVSGLEFSESEGIAEEMDTKSTCRSMSYSVIFAVVEPKVSCEVLSCASFFREEGNEVYAIHCSWTNFIAIQILLFFTLSPANRCHPLVLKIEFWQQCPAVQALRDMCARR